jgi:hypothetical protein
MKAIMAKKNLQPHPWFIEKVIQLYEMIVVRHGLMLVGPRMGLSTAPGSKKRLHLAIKRVFGFLIYPNFNANPRWAPRAAAKP